ncbi:CZB domain-containing protein [Parathalassolituus penaei]|uniref:CZB domain-containing protein n=1 Tax=Parathalassolituus penaei TaxID=2997323 RepID=A0A9X3ISW3_9GAMM|nr:CZB domain-containing protein [Parathalassolituus penaei]MCY0966261.1 CZB domain-containing protein [Parathalassolituus penaei]
MEYLSFSHGGHHYAVPLEHVRYIAASTSVKTTRIAYGNNEERDTINYEGHSCLVFNLAELLGDSPELRQSRQLLELLDQRQQDHENWMNNLEEALKNDGHFTLARNHRDCAFGRWYQDFQTSDAEFKAIMERFDQPHQRIHQLANELLDLHSKGETSEALAILQHHRKTTLRRLIDLFGDARQHLKGVARPTVVVLQRLRHPDDPSRDLFGLQVDHIGDVFSCDDPVTRDSSDYWLPTFADGWLKDIAINNHKVTALALAPERISC